jgi:hypothetical protein
MSCIHTIHGLSYKYLHKTLWFRHISLMYVWQSFKRAAFKVLASLLLWTCHVTHVHSMCGTLHIQRYITDVMCECSPRLFDRFKSCLSPSFPFTFRCHYSRRIKLFPIGMCITYKQNGVWIRQNAIREIVQGHESCALTMYILSDGSRVWPATSWTDHKLRGCIQKFPDWPPGERIANGTALCH